MFDKKVNELYLPGLNGLRTVAAVSVLFCHIIFTDFGVNFFFDWPIAHYGVTLFFVISGFLITFLLLKEKERTQDISINKFYYRRILRIWPIYFLYIAVSILIYYFWDKLDQIFIGQFWFYLLLAGNFKELISNSAIAPFGHLWSIGVEEQFYLFWPWSVKFTKNKLLKIAFFVLVLFFVIRVCP
ncbi:MAG: acyltransferase family protein [Bacteroidia bacterium]